MKQKYLANKNLAPIEGGASPSWSMFRDPFYPRFWPERIYQPAHIKKPCGIFVCDMSELFGDWLPEKWQDVVFQTIVNCPQHRFYLLTKQPQNLIKFSPFPPNCYVGVTATDDLGYGEAIRWLNKVEATIKYISFEPLLESPAVHYLTHGEVINWIIIGAQTRPNVYPKIEWVEEIVRAADSAGIPVFLKDNLKPLIDANDMAKYRKLWQHNDKGALAFPLGIKQKMPK